MSPRLPLQFLKFPLALLLRSLRSLRAGIAFFVLKLLLVISVMLIKLGRPARYTLIPMSFVLLTSAWAAVLKLIEFYQAGNWLLVVIDVVVLVTSLMVMLEAISVIAKFRRENSEDGRAA